MKPSRWTMLLWLCGVILLMPLCSGCAVAGAVAGKVLPPPTIHPKYLGLAGQSVGVMVWTDRGVQVDYPSLALDLANSTQKKLMAETKTEELKKSFFPVQPASIARYQMDHPTLDFKDVTEVAPKLGVNRLIYLEIEDFSTRAPGSVELFRGSMTTTLKVVEIDGDSAKVAYEENGIKATFPANVPPDGTPDGDDVRFYAGTIDAMSTQVRQRLVSYQEE
jgi:hypothetical protein